MEHFLHANQLFTKSCPIRNFTSHQRRGEDNVFSHVCLSVYRESHGIITHDTGILQTCSHLFNLDLIYWVPLICSNIFKLDLPFQPSPHEQTQLPPYVLLIDLACLRKSATIFPEKELKRRQDLRRLGRYPCN